MIFLLPRRDILVPWRVPLPKTNSHNNENTSRKGKEETSHPNPAICVGFPWLLVGGFNPFEKY